MWTYEDLVAASTTSSDLKPLGVCRAALQHVGALLRKLISDAEQLRLGETVFSKDERPALQRDVWITADDGASKIAARITLICKPKNWPHPDAANGVVMIVGLDGGNDPRHETDILDFSEEEERKILRYVFAAAMVDLQRAEMRRQ